MNSMHNFRSYTQEVDFEGIRLPLPNIYRYITRDEYGFINAWRDKPKRLAMNTATDQKCRSR